MICICKHTQPTTTTSASCHGRIFQLSSMNMPCFRHDAKTPDTVDAIIGNTDTHVRIVYTVHNCKATQQIIHCDNDSVKMNDSLVPSITSYSDPLFEQFNTMDQCIKYIN